MKKNKFMLVLAIGAAVAQTDVYEATRGPSLRTLIPLAVTTLLIGSSNADASDLPRFDTATCNKAGAMSIIQMAGTSPQKGDFQLNITQMFSKGGPAQVPGVTQPYRNCTAIATQSVSLWCCQGIANIKNFFHNVTSFCIEQIAVGCTPTSAPAEIFCGSLTSDGYNCN